MANYYACARSNYFQVKDLEAFKKEIETPSIEIHEEGEKGICILFYEGIISDYYDENGEDYIEINWADIFKRHLKEFQVAVFMESGAEKLRYIVGYAIAYSWTGETVEVNLNSIYGLAGEKFGTGVFGAPLDISLAEY